MKIDAEGAELLVLKGGHVLLSTPELRPRAVLVELAALNQLTYGYRPENVIEYMKEHGYNVYSVTPTGTKRGWSSEDSSVDALFLAEQ